MHRLATHELTRDPRVGPSPVGGHGLPTHTPLSMLAYIGPAGALSLIGSFLALVGGVALALVGFLWYPLKRFWRARRSTASAVLRPRERAEA